ncbi:MAG: hypothetical protein RR552_00780 [Oscillospiraceae bacterium]
MKKLFGVISVLLIICTFAFIGCGKNTPEPTTTTKPANTNGVGGEIVTKASEGASDAITKVSEGVSEAITKVSEGVHDLVTNKDDGKVTTTKAGQ